MPVEPFVPYWQAMAGDDNVTEDQDLLWILRVAQVLSDGAGEERPETPATTLT